MAYMVRLGLWGPGSAFPDFEAFLDSMKKRGVSFMEMLAMEMKAEGNYVARGLSFRCSLQCRLSYSRAELIHALIMLSSKSGTLHALSKDLPLPLWLCHRWTSPVNLPAKLPLCLCRYFQNVCLQV